MKTQGISDLVGRKFKFTYTPLSSYISGGSVRLKDRDLKCITGELVNFDNTAQTIFIENEREFRIITLQTVSEMTEIIDKSV